MINHNIKKLNELIEFSSENINSKILAQNGNSMVILLAIKKEQVLSEHTSPVDAFVYVLDGEIEFSIKKDDISEKIENKYIIKKEEIFFFKANEKHIVLGKKDSKLLVVRT